MIRLSHIGLPLIGGVIVSFAVFACSSSDEPQADATGGAPGTGGSKATGGGTASGGSGATGGGASTGGNTEALYVCENAAPRDPGKDGTEGAACCNTTTNGNVGKCTKESSITDATQRAAFGYDSCSKSAGLKCAPDAAQLATAEQNGVYATCTATLGEGPGLEGRCLPKCFVAGVGAAAQLKQDGCQNADLVCAPCFNPIDGSDTGACKQKAGDAPAKPAPAPYKKCGSDLGICVPASLVTDPVQKAALDRAFEGTSSGCDGTDLCAPIIKAKDQAACFTKCNSVAGLVGACVPEYLVPAAQRDLIRSATGCATGELCAPCQDPTSTPEPNMATGACN
jgi:hypothetical protein